MITDLSYLREMSGNDIHFIREMIDLFRDQVEEFTRTLPELLERSDYERLSKTAHKAKSSVAVMGMTREAEMLKELEANALKTENTDSYKHIINTFIERTGEALRELDEYLKNNGS